MRHLCKTFLPHFITVQNTIQLAYEADKSISCKGVDSCCLPMSSLKQNLNHTSIDLAVSTMGQPCVGPRITLDVTASR